MINKNLDFINLIVNEYNLSIEDKILYLLAKDEIISKLVQMIEVKTNAKSTSEWLPVSMVAEQKALTSDAVRKQLQNGDFEEDLDFKYKGARIYVYQGAVERIQRKRRSSKDA